MTEREALKLALEALELEDMACRYEKDQTPEHITKAITAIREALAEQPAPPPWWPAVENIMNEYGLQAIDFVADFKAALSDHIVDANKMVEQPAPPPECQTEAEKTAFAFGWWKALEMHRTSAQQQEPFGYFKPEPFGWTDCAETDEGAIALYERPQPSKQWVGLTDEQIGMAFRKAFPVGGVVFTNGAIDFARVIETKLKEKNA